MKANCKSGIGVGHAKATEGAKATRNRRDVDTDWQYIIIVTVLRKLLVSSP